MLRVHMQELPDSVMTTKITKKELLPTYDTRFDGYSALMLA